MDDQQIEEQIHAKGLNAPRVRPEQVEAEIAGIYFIIASDAIEAHSAPVHDALRRLTICVLVLRNGFTVTGESACASAANFDEEIGRNIAFAKAKEKIWPLLGFSLLDALAIQESFVFQKAKHAHEINRAYCAAHGDHSQLPWDEAPDWQKASAIEGVKHVMAGQSPEQLHESWCEHKLSEGWRHGAVKDVDAKTHPCLVPYDQLPPEQRVKDHLFRAAVLS